MSDKDKGRSIPKKGADKEKIRAWMDAFFDRDSSFRRELEDRDFIEPRAFVEGHQWKQVVKGGDPRRAPRFTDWPEDHPMPRPVDNEIMPACDNEISRLARRNSDMEVEPVGTDPDRKAGAKIATDVGKSHMETINWPIKRRTFWHHNITYGTAILKSHLVKSYRPDKLVRVGISGALRCAGIAGAPDSALLAAGEFMLTGGKPACGFTLASKTLPMDKLAPMMEVKELSDAITPTFAHDAPMDQRSGYDAARCLDCGGRLEEFDVSVEEAGGQDFFGRPLGKELPLGEAGVENVPPDCVFFENEGIGVTPETCTEWGVEMPRSLKWIREHYNRNLEEIEPDAATKITERFPMSGEYSAESRGSLSVTGGRGKRNLYDNHSVVREFYSDPDRDNPRGRLIVTAGVEKCVILEDGDLYIEHEDPEGGETYFPRVHFEVARCFPRDNMMWGQGYPVMVMSLQRRINMRASQMTELAERMGIIAVKATRGMRLSRAWVDGLIATILRWEPDATAQGKEPEIIKGEFQLQMWAQEVQDCRQAIKDILGIYDAEVGNLGASGLKSGVALQINSEKASERRQQREQEGVNCFEGTFSHQMQLIQHYYLENENRKYRVRVGNAREERSFKGLDFAGQTDVKVKEAAKFDATLAGKQTLIESVGANPDLAPKTPYAIREYFRTIGAPTAMMDENNVQLDAAERKFFEWRANGVVPAIDPNLDNHGIYWDTYGRLFLDNESVEMAEKSGWDRALPKLTGWDKALPNAQRLADNVSGLADMQGQPREAVWQTMGPQLVQVTAMQAMPPPPPQDPSMPPQAPPPLPQVPMPPSGEVPPEDLAGLIWWVWKNRLIARGFAKPPVPIPGQPPGPAFQPEFETFARMKAVHEAHRLYASGVMQQQQAGVAAPPAPGGEQAQPLPMPQPEMGQVQGAPPVPDMVQ